MPINVDPIPSSTARYEARADVLAITHDDNATVIWDLDDDGTEDTGAMESDEVHADTYIDRYFAANGVTVPINTSTASAVVVQSLADIGAHMTVWYGYAHRGLATLAARFNVKASDLGGDFAGFKDYADEELAKLLTIIRAQDPGDVEHGSAAGQLAVSVGPPKHYPGTGSVRPFAVTLPNAISPASW